VTARCPLCGWEFAVEELRTEDPIPTRRGRRDRPLPEPVIPNHEDRHGRECPGSDPGRWPVGTVVEVDEVNDRRGVVLFRCMACLRVYENPRYHRIVNKDPTTYRGEVSTHRCSQNEVGIAEAVGVRWK